MDKTKSILTAVFFCLIIAAGGIVSVILPDADFSYAERRKLAQMPRITAQSVLSGKYFEDLDSYTTDRLVPREFLRGIKAVLSLHVFRQLDIRGVYITDGSAVDMDYPLNEASVYSFISKINSVRENLIKPRQRVFYSVIPDKNYYYAEKSGHLALDYEKMLNMLSEGFNDMEYIDIFGALCGEDYYKTDSHWRQERLYNVTKALAGGLGLEGNPFPGEFEKGVYFPFYGVYYGQTALPLEPDTIVYLETPVTDNAVVSHIEPGKADTVYDTARLGGADSFDVFLSGATAVCRVVNPMGPEGRELVIFRDSFAGALAPLLLSEYSEIILVDLRYINPALLGGFMEFTGQDVLFLYSTGMINSSGALRGF